ncbi:hypothetical protein G7085_16390 [Tessaracoccus sp. HDW20]|uniref:hypothetical protein n=1 Tax=Tessaracoccus coleopterorum TaxID=2714950 RepID=UPI0018D3372C|nr:hypothetical protein [Tessaracoccus coleopterorum]NHB85641.1 hypothetical protein [Tessaracoccus coleopterorum]
MGQRRRGPLPAQLPDGVDPATVAGIRISYLSTDGADIEPMATGTAELDLVARESITGVTSIDNTVSATVTVGEDSSDPGTDTGVFTPAAATIPLQTTKTFNPDVTAAGESSTVTLTATNTSTRVLESLTIREPGTGTAPLGTTLTYGGWANGAQWPNGATALRVTYLVEVDGVTSEVTIESSTPGRMPAVPRAASSASPPPTPARSSPVPRRRSPSP